MKKGMKEELELYPDSAREGGDAPESEAKAAPEGEEAPGPDPRPMMLVYAGPAYFANKIHHMNEEENKAMMMAVYAGPEFFAGGMKAEKEESEEEEPEEEKNGNGGPAYYQDMPEYVPMDAVPDASAAPKTQEGLDFFCPACGAKVRIGVKFCPECGTPLGSLWAEADENFREGGENGGDDGSIDGDSVNV